MRSRLFASALLLLAAGAPARAEDPPPPAPAPVSASEEAPLRTVVLGLKARRGVDDELAQVMSDVVQGVLAKDPSRVVIGRDEIARLVDFEAEKQAMGCEDDSCLAEIGRALDARRLVTGSLAVVGERYLVVISELDAETVTPVARAQEQVEKDEGVLLEAVSRLASTLVDARETAAAASLVAQAGSLSFSTEPSGAQVVLDGKPMGSTPVRLDNLAVGTHHLRLVRRDYDTVEVDVPVYAGALTKVEAQLRVNRALAEQNYDIRLRAHEEKATRHYVFAGTKAAGAGICCAAGGLLGAANLAKRSAKPGDWLVPGGVAVAGVALGAVAGLDLLAPPTPPEPEWEQPRKLRVIPPEGRGSPIEVDLSASAMPH